MSNQIRLVIRLACGLAATTVLAGVLGAQLVSAFKDPRAEILKRAFRTDRDSPLEAPLSITVSFLPSSQPESKLIIRYRSRVQADVEYIRASVASGTALERVRAAGSDDI